MNSGKEFNDEVKLKLSLLDMLVQNKHTFGYGDSASITKKRDA